MRPCIAHLVGEAEFVKPFPGLKADRKLDDRELTRTIRLAITAEHEAVHLYEAIADSTDDAEVKRVMQSIADEEKVHIGELEQLLSDKAPDEEGHRRKGAQEVSAES